MQYNYPGLTRKTLIYKNLYIKCSVDVINPWFYTHCCCLHSETSQSVTDRLDTDLVTWWSGSYLHYLDTGQGPPIVEGCCSKMQMQIIRCSLGATCHLLSGISLMNINQFQIVEPCKALPQLAQCPSSIVHSDKATKYCLTIAQLYPPPEATDSKFITT